jgi:hypothetical protein
MHFTLVWAKLLLNHAKSENMYEGNSVGIVLSFPLSGHLRFSDDWSVNYSLHSDDMM